MRHEVLKHNTTLLPTVADALERGDRGPALDASGILLGGQGAAGVIDLWDRYIGELEAIGNSHGVRLNLRYIDEQIAPMCSAFDSLRQLAPRLHKGRPEVMVERIREISTAVNDVGYRELGKLLHEVCVLEVDEALLKETWTRVAREPGIVGERVPAPVFEAGENLRVRVFREDFSDILANLLRNACEAAMSDRAGPKVRIGVRVVEEMDAITGLSWVAIRVLDNASAELSNEMIHSRRIGRGIGLALDLAKRSQGSLVVEPEAGWSKAVVLRLSMAEEAEG
jgi:signal transduction histidine kinase